jgi:hypothetical protein
MVFRHVLLKPIGKKEISTGIYLYIYNLLKFK